MFRLTRLSTPLAITAALLLGACATNQVDRQEQTVMKAQQVKSQVPATEAQVDATLSALDNLMNAQPETIKASLERYSMEVDRMQQHAQDIQRDARAMTRDSEAYLANWDAAHSKIHNADLRQESEQQRFALMDRYQRFDRTYQRTQSAMDAFLTNITDIRTAIANDPTMRGIQTVEQTTVVQAAKENGNELKTRLQAMQENATTLATALSEPSMGGTKREARQE